MELLFGVKIEGGVRVEDLVRSELSEPRGATAVL